MANKADIPDLYEAEWPEDAENGTFKTKLVSCEPKNHKFNYTKRANEVKCSVCGVGYLLSADMEVKDGHIYFNETLVS